MWYSLTCSLDGTKLAAVNISGYVYFSDDSGDSWTQLDPAGTNQLWGAITCSADGNRLLAAVHGGYVYTGHRPSNKPSGYGWAVGLSDGDYGTILHTRDGGRTWIRQGDSAQLPNAGFSDICVIDKKRLLVVGDLQPNGDYNVFKSVNGGKAWTL
ncbi:MAG: hypothetical protein JRJ82_23395, partial [Deltaproteobacteria bacterium]|nr:hypothetical protein [Deltaproteobacteria bacterium]